MNELSNNAVDSSEPTMTLKVDAGPDQTVNEGETMLLCGTASAVTEAIYPLWPVDISADGRFLAVGWDKNVTFFSTSSNVPLWTFNTATDGKVGDVKLSDDGRYLTVGSYRTIFYFDTTSSTPLWSATLGDSILRYDGDPGNRMDMSYDGRYVAAAATGQRMVMFDTTSASPTIPYWDYAYGDNVECVRFSEDGRYLSMGSFNGQLKLASVSGRSILWSASAGDRVYSTSLSYDGGLISIGRGNSHRVSLYSSASSSPLWSSTLMGRQFEQVMSDNGDYLVSGNHVDHISGTWSGFAFWDTSSSNPIWTYWTGATMGTCNADAVDMVANADYVVGGSRNNNVYLFSQLADGSPGWSSMDGIPVFIYTTGGLIHYNGVSISADGTYFAAGSFEGVVYLFSTVGTPHLVWSWSTASSTPFGGPLTFHWDINNLVDSDGDGDSTNDVDVVGQNATCVYGDNGVYTVTLTVSDDQGNIATDTCEITVNNVNPQIDPLTPITTSEGTLFGLYASSSDPGSDDLTFTWQFEYGPTVTNTCYNDGMAPDPPSSPRGIFPFSASDNVTHTYGDDGEFKVSLTVTDDDGGTVVITTIVTVMNVAPTITLVIAPSGDEGSVLNFSAAATDPGSDDLEFNWNFEYGPTITNMSYNDGLNPDPLKSPRGTYPFSTTDAVSHIYGDNYGYTLILTVMDDDIGSTMYTTTITVDNVAPYITQILFPSSVDEGSPFNLTAFSSDPGSDDLTFTWELQFGPTITNIYYNDGTGPDPYPSPGGSFPFTSTDSVTHTYGDNGIYTITLNVEDDDGGITTYTSSIIVDNVAPTIEPFGPFTVDECSLLGLSATSTDPGSDDLTFTWEFGMGPTVTNTIYNDGASPDPFPSPWGTYPCSASDSAEHTYGDNGVFPVTLTVTDDDGGMSTYITNITVNNVAPEIVSLEAYMYVNVILRVAGEKYHSVGINLYEDGTEIWAAKITRHPGSPDEQTATISGLRIYMTKSYSTRVDYLPNDPRINGNVWGANPVWIDITFENGSDLRLHHTFNVRQSYWDSDHWNHIDPWEVDLKPHLVGCAFEVAAHITDPGSDDETLTCEYGSQSITATHLNNPPYPDPYPSPDVRPVDLTAMIPVIYEGPGTLTLGVEDDDGAMVSSSTNIA